MTEIIRERRHREERHYRREFALRDAPGSRFSFVCEPDGNADREQLHPATIENLERCLGGEHDVVDLGVVSWVERWVEPAVIRCGCGSPLEVPSFTNSCERCGRDYNSGGQLLAPREQRGEEAGESLADILRIR